MTAHHNHKQVLPTAEWLTADRVREITKLIEGPLPMVQQTSPDQEAAE
ncbi:hypothetical protein [Acetobacter vaccinii]|nr:hypothetical protein [Acetobacter vaccinii]